MMPRSRGRAARWARLCVPRLCLGPNGVSCTPLLAPTTALRHKLVSTSAKPGPLRLKFGPASANVDLAWPRKGHVWPEVDQIRPDVGQNLVPWGGTMISLERLLGNAVYARLAGRGESSERCAAMRSMICRLDRGRCPAVAVPGRCSRHASARAGTGLWEALWTDLTGNCWWESCDGWPSAIAANSLLELAYAGLVAKLGRERRDHDGRRIRAASGPSQRRQGVIPLEVSGPVVYGGLVSEHPLGCRPQPRRLLHSEQVGAPIGFERLEVPRGASAAHAGCSQVVLKSRAFSP